MAWCRTWTIDYPVQWSICVSSGLNELTTINQRSSVARRISSTTNAYGAWQSTSCFYKYDIWYPQYYISLCLPWFCPTWWRHQMATFSALLAICAGNSPVPGEFPAQRPVTRSFDLFCDLRLNKRLRKQSWGWWFETPSPPLWRHCNERTGAWNELHRTSTNHKNVCKCFYFLGIYCLMCCILIHSHRPDATVTKCYIWSFISSCLGFIPYVWISFRTDPITIFCMLR